MATGDSPSTKMASTCFSSPSAAISCIHADGFSRSGIRSKIVRLWTREADMAAVSRLSGVLDADRWRCGGDFVGVVLSWHP